RRWRRSRGHLRLLGRRARPGHAASHVGDLTLDRLDPAAQPRGEDDGHDGEDRSDEKDEPEREQEELHRSPHSRTAACTLTAEPSARKADLGDPRRLASNSAPYRALGSNSVRLPETRQIRQGGCSTRYSKAPPPRRHACSATARQIDLVVEDREMAPLRGEERVLPCHRARSERLIRGTIAPAAV